MKLAVIMLVVLGLVAAGAAAIFVQSLAFFEPKEVPTFDVLVATANLEARTPLTGDFVEVKKMPLTGLPQDYLSNWSQAAGKILKVAVVKGQPLADSQFIPKNSIDDLLRPGMLAFPAPLPRRSTAVDLLYPGCIVDVFATFPLSNREKGEAVVTPLLQNIQVLGIEDDTVIPPADEKKAAETAKRRSSSSSGNITVTLEVTARQAAALQLALQKGTLGLAMRNPTDKGLNPMEPMVVKEGQLTAASESLDPQTLALVSSIQRMLNPLPATDPNTTEPATVRPISPTGSDPNVVGNMPSIGGAETISGLQPRRAAWQVTVIRGQKVEETELETTDTKRQEQEVAQKTGG